MRRSNIRHHNWRRGDGDFRKQIATPLPGNVDYNTYANYNNVQAQSFHLEWDLDLSAQRIKASISLLFLSLTRLTQVELDWWNLELAGIPHPCTYYTTQSGYVNTNCTIERKTQGQGDVLVVALPAALPANV
jgi:hypothetical protein